MLKVCCLFLVIKRPEFHLMVYQERAGRRKKGLKKYKVQQGGNNGMKKVSDRGTGCGC